MGKIKYIVLLIILGGLIYIPFNGGVHLFDWDEINFAESSREMIETGDYTTVRINYEPFWEKPPLFIWMQVVAMKYFGVNEFAARFPNAICGIITLVLLFLMGAKVYNPTFGLLWALAYLASVLPTVFFKSGIIDPWFNLFILLGIWFLILFWHRAERKNGYRDIILSAFFIGLAVLTKGPVALLLWGITAFVFLIFNRFRIALNLRHILLFLGVFLLTGGSWFIMLLIQGNAHIIGEFIVYQVRLFSTQDAGHGGFPGYHFVVLLIGMFPASLYAMRAFMRNRFDNQHQRDVKRWMMILFWVVLIIFSIVKTKIVHYSSMCYFPLTYLAAWSAYYYMNGRIHMRWYFHLAVGFIGLIFIAFAYAIPYIDEFKQYIVQSGLIHDNFAIGNLQAMGGWTTRDLIPAYVLTIGIIVYFIFLKIHHRPLAYITLGLSSLLFTLGSILLFTGKIEKYTQNAAIEFYTSKLDKDCYVQNLSFKSYAPLFYWKKKPGANPLSNDLQWLLAGDIDKPVYFVFKNIHKKRYLDQYPGLYLLYEKNGFVFCSRRPIEIK